MQPLTVIFGILLGSAVSIAIGLAMVLVVYLFLMGEHAQLREELPSLLRSLGLFLPLSAAAAAGFVGQLKRTRWRRAAAATAWIALLAVVWVYWPKG